jgi:hypothetical protein
MPKHANFEGFFQLLSARAESGQAAAAPPRSVMNSRRCMCPLKTKLFRNVKNLALCDRAA